MSDLRELYQEIILDHNRQPRNFRKNAEATHTAEGYNPLCGDRISVYLTVEDGIVQDVSFQGVGCAISTASASLMTDQMKGKTIDEVAALFEDMHTMLTTEADLDIDRLGKLAVFSGVRAYPMRVKCATLCWHTLKAALDRQAEAVTTE